MTPFLLPLRNSLWLKTALLSLASGITGIVIWQITNTLGQSIIVSILIVGISLFIIALVIGRAIANNSVKATDFLARAILLVTQDNNYTLAPNPETLDASKDFLQQLAKNIYDLASSQAKHLYDVEQHNTYKADYYKTMINSIPQPIIVLDSQQKIVFVNEAAINYIEQPAEQLIDKPLYESINLSFNSSTLEDLARKLPLEYRC